jgi:hypothetical protein
LITLARSTSAHVQGCLDCGCATVHLGPLSFRLDVSTLHRFAETLAIAASNSKQIVTTTSPKKELVRS